MASANQTPEQAAREHIDSLLAQAGWAVQDKKSIDFNASLGVAIREYQTDVGPADYVLFVDREEDTISSLAGRLARLNKQLTPDEERRLTEKTGGKPLTRIVHGLMDAIDPDTVEVKAREQFVLPEHQAPTEVQLEEARTGLVKQATQVFTGELNTLIESIKRDHDQIIDTVNIDSVTFAGWDQDANSKASELIQDFSAYLAEHKDEITALSIFYNQPYRRRELTYQMIRKVLDTLKQDKPRLAPLRVWQAYAHVDELKSKAPENELVALVALIRRACGIDEALTPYDQTVSRNFQNWIMKRHRGNAPKFNNEQMVWLRMIRDHTASSFHIERGDLDYAPFDAQGGLGRIWQLFGEEMDAVLDELNEELAA